MSGILPWLEELGLVYIAAPRMLGLRTHDG